MTNAPRVSVLMPFLNTRPFLAEAIESVLWQTGTEWELLLVDDGSTDGSSDVARAYAASDRRTQLLWHSGGQTRGIGASHNLALSRARGEYIAILDSDDIWLPHTLSRRVEVLDSFPAAGMVYGNTQFWYSWSGVRGDIDRDYVPKLRVPTRTLLLPPVLLPLFLNRRAAVPCTCSVLVRRDLAQRLGGFEESLRIYVDQAFYAKLVLAAPVVAVDEVWARYRRHPASSCSVTRADGLSIERGLEFAAWLDRYLVSAGNERPDIRRAVERLRWRLHHPGIARRLARVRRAVAHAWRST